MKVIKDDNTKRNRFFEKLCLMSQEKIKSFLSDELSKRGREVEIGDGFLYSKGTIPIMLTAHMDTVHEELPKTIVYKDGTISSPQGIGGDDRCGIYMILKIIKELDCHVLFCEDEEVGGEGSAKFIQTETCENLVGVINYVIELDRMNDRDAVYYSCDNSEFEGFIEKEFWSFAYGSFTDICNICPEIKCAGVNLSCGYYKQHTKDEYVVLKEMENAIDEVKRLIKRTTENDYFEYIEKTYYWKNYYNSYYDKKSDYTNDNSYDEYYYEIEWMEKGEIKSEEFVAVSEAEAVGQFLMSHSNLTFNDVTGIYVM